MDPLVSVIVPCFNQGQFVNDLLEALDAGCKFTHEVIVVNDGSTDALTLRNLKGLRAKSDRQELIIINRTNGGLPAARNTGLDAARGKYIQFLDADDLIAKGKLDLQVEALEADSALAIHLTEYVLCDVTRTRFWKPETSTIAGFSFDVPSFITHWERGLTIPIHCGLFRRSAIGTIRFTEQLKAKEDWIFWIVLAATGASFDYSPFVGAIYRQHDSSMTKNGRAMALSWLQAVKHLLDTGFEIDPVAKESLLEHYNRFYVRFFSIVNPATQQAAVRNTDLQFLLSFVK